MPAIDDYDPNDDEQSGFGSGGSSGSSSGGGQLFGGASKQHEQAYTPWSRFIDANSETSDRTAGKLSSNATADAKTAQGDLSAAQGAFDAGVNSNYQAATSAPPPPDTNAAAKNPYVASGSFGGSSFGAPAPVAPPSPTSQPNSKTAGAAPWSRLSAGVGLAPPPPPAPGPMAHAPTQPGQPPPPASTQTATITGTPRQLTRDAIENGPKGPSDLEAAAGKDAWSKLLADTTKANSEAGALGSEAGVQAQLQQNGDSGAGSAFDAALVNGAGGQGFQNIANQYGGDKLGANVVNSDVASQAAWASLTGDASATKQRRDDDASRTAENQRQWAQADADTAAEAAEAAAAKAGTPGEAKPYDPSNGSEDAKYRNGMFVQGDSVTGIGNQQQFLTDMMSGMDSQHGPGGGPNEVAAVAMQQLGITRQQLMDDIKRMTPKEYQDFMVNGVVPLWLETGPNAGAGVGTHGVSKGTENGWLTEYGRVTKAGNQAIGPDTLKWTTDTGEKVGEAAIAVL